MSSFKDTEKNSANTFDAIIIGSGISGSWAAKEMCEQGLKTLVLERGREVKHGDYPTAMMNTWDTDLRNQLPRQFKIENPVVSRCYALDESTKHFFVKDQEHPYIQEKPYDWIRGYQVGGKSLIWARQTQRWSKYEFENPAKYGYTINWPIGYEDLAPWYSHVEKFVGISGNKDGLDTLPDSESLPAWEMNEAERIISNAITKQYPDRPAIMGRCAHLTEPQPIHLEQGRGQCQARNLCYRGCPYGAYFSANSSTLPHAAKTGNLTLRADSVVDSIIYDDEFKKAVGVKVIDRLTKAIHYFFARVIFVNAACLNSNLILLNSKSNRFPSGLGNDNDLLGKYVAFHNYRGSVTAEFTGALNSYYYGRRPTSIMIPNFRNVRLQEMDFQGGYMTFFTASRMGWNRAVEGEQIGADYKAKITQPGNWSIYMMMQGETIPKLSNHVRLSKDQVDEWGVPQLITYIDYDENDEKLVKDFLKEAEGMLKAAACINIKLNDSQQAPGLDIHEMGGVRMGNDPKTSLLNKWNQMHACPNVFVTDGACMTSTGVQNPSLTFMALAARAANYAASRIKKNEL
jgi:choline dehydrogenase-like flavoprotein